MGIDEADTHRGYNTHTINHRSSCDVTWTSAFALHLLAEDNGGNNRENNGGNANLGATATGVELGTSR